MKIICPEMVDRHQFPRFSMAEKLVALNSDRVFAIKFIFLIRHAFWSENSSGMNVVRCKNNVLGHPTSFRVALTLINCTIVSFVGLIMCIHCCTRRTC